VPLAPNTFIFILLYSLFTKLRNCQIKKLFKEPGKQFFHQLPVLLIDGISSGALIRTIIRIGLNHLVNVNKSKKNEIRCLAGADFEDLKLILKRFTIIK